MSMKNPASLRSELDSMRSVSACLTWGMFFSMSKVMKPMGDWN